MALKVVRRKSTGAYTISGTVLGRRIQRRAQSNQRRLAGAEAAALETQILQTQWFGAKPASKTLGEAMLSYADAAPRSRRTLQHLIRLIEALGENTPLNTIDQAAVTKARDKLLKPDTSPATYIRAVIAPLRAVLVYAAKQDWLDRVPYFTIPKQPRGRTRFLLPAQAEALIEAAAPHLRPLLVFLIGTGARMSEALELEWRDVDLAGRRVIFWVTKSGKRRVASLPPRVVIVLAELPDREGHVFLSHRGQPYWSSDRNAGGQIKVGWKGALRRAGLDPELSPHDLRHTWATWRLATDTQPNALMRLRDEGGWSSVTLVERYGTLPATRRQSTSSSAVTTP